jgi:hypothetical protein
MIASIYHYSTRAGCNCLYGPFSVSSQVCNPTLKTCVIVSSKPWKLGPRRNARLRSAFVSVARLSRNSGSGGAAAGAVRPSPMRGGGRAPSQPTWKPYATRSPSNLMPRWPTYGRGSPPPGGRGSTARPSAGPYRALSCYSKQVAPRLGAGHGARPDAPGHVPGDGEAPRCPPPEIHR